MNRVDTALKIAETTFKGKVRNVVLTTGENYPDALAGSVLAYKLEAPILLIGSSNVDTEKVLFYIKEKMESSGNVYILGGKGVVSEEIEQKVKDTGIKNVKRLSGATRYETAAQIVANLGVQEGTPVVIACGENFADALSVSITAAVNQYPILLAEKNGISDTVKKELSKIKPKKVFIIGLQGAISEEVENQISKELTINKSNIVRIGGSNRYDTSLEVAKYFNLNGKSVCIASGNNYPDALVGSAYAAKFNAPLILCGNKLTENMKEYMKNRNFVDITIFGGEGAVNKIVEDELKY
nr:cell wall-binding repeat-containing protein [Clostridium tetanomorphum]